MLKNIWLVPVLFCLGAGIKAPQDPFVPEPRQACRVSYRNLDIRMQMTPDSVRQHLPKMAKWYAQGFSEEYVDSVFVVYRDAAQDLVEVPQYGQALPELYLEFTKTKLVHFKAVYKIALDNFRKETVDRVMQSLAVCHPLLADPLLRYKLYTAPYKHTPQKGCEETMYTDTVSTMFQLAFTYEMFYKDSL